MTPKQKAFIERISSVTGEEYNKDMTTTEASEWINQNIEDYNQEILEDECNSYGLPNQ